MLAKADEFFRTIRTTLFLGEMSQPQVDGTNAILAAWPAKTDLRWLAYGLATAFHETAATMKPIAEYGKGRGHLYGVPAGPWHQVYYGRGDVQDTWYANYVHGNAALHALGVLKDGENMVAEPDLALRPDVAAAIMVTGMKDGWFTGRKLADYFPPDRPSIADYIGARAIINGTDCAAKIASYALHIRGALEAGGYAP